MITQERVRELLDYDPETQLEKLRRELEDAKKPPQRP